MISAPFNFVPLSEKVFFPHWTEQVSHDIPFEDGMSGELKVTITAECPLFIRNHEINGNKFYENNPLLACNFRMWHIVWARALCLINDSARNCIEFFTF